MIYLLNPVVDEKGLVISRIGRCVTRAKAEYVYPPTELLYVASYLRKNGCAVKVIDGALAGSMAEVIDKIKNPKFFIIMAGIFSYNIDSRFINALRNLFPNAKVIVFGQGASFITEDYLKVADYAVFGEPEKPILEIVRGKKRIKGVSYRKKNKCVINKTPNFVKNLDYLPFPARNLIDNSKYKHAFMRPYAMVYSSRGCPYKCIFCTSKGYSPLFRERSVKNVINELKELKEKYNITNFGFMDETFTIRKKRVVEICKEMIREGLDMKWIALGRADNVDFETLEWMKRAGCRIMMYGIESSSQKVLDYLKKGYKTSDVEKAIKLTKDAGIEVHGFFIFGSPPDTEESIEESILFARYLDLDYASFNIYVPYPGTESYKMLEKQGKITTKDWSKYDQSLNELVFKHDSLNSAKIQKLIKKAYRKFYFSPDFIVRRFIKDAKHPVLLLRDIGNAGKIIKNFVFG